MGAITYFYTGSTESEVEKQFADLRNVHDAEQFIAYIERTIINAVYGRLLPTDAAERTEQRCGNLSASGTAILQRRSY